MWHAGTRGGVGRIGGPVDLRMSPRSTEIPDTFREPDHYHRYRRSAPLPGLVVQVHRLEVIHPIEITGPPKDEPLSGRNGADPADHVAQEEPNLDRQKGDEHTANDREVAAARENIQNMSPPVTDTDTRERGSSR